ncbi:serine/threonine-protein kinase LMTK1 isoform X2 [Denticeps clupeoides]|uniref:serine/threonine-protein kinase LMTK1 isoform X2 n=1 Tax=Denticeps clupeoides TaxID=299321 RepID=UPI0010A31FB4|nr:serine/threonine-protein kinase LMTK1-like isoform X2 [Denticeps clupeoides]
MCRIVGCLRSADVARHSLLYVNEIGHGWFGKVLLAELNIGLSCTQVVVKELKSSAGVQDQMHFLQEAQPYRSLQHPALLQCLAQYTEVTPYLLVMEFCALGDVKGYLRSCRASEIVTPDPLVLQRMACDIASGILHLHKHNFIHGDLALRNCLLTSDMMVKIGDYGLSHNKYKEDYFITSDQTWVPLRWIAPELIDEVHGNLLMVEQSKPSNIWSLGVTIWELFELGNQPYWHYSDRQVLSYAVKDEQLKLSKPQLKAPLAERWYEVMQFCWLQPDQRPNAEEVHLLLSYLCAKGVSEAEEDFERRWNLLRPNSGHLTLHGASSLPMEVPSSASSSFPLLDPFSVDECFHSEPGDDILTVTETRHGLNFEYKWQHELTEQSFHHSSSTINTLGQGNPQCKEIYVPGCGVDGLTLGVSPSFFDPKPLHTPGAEHVLTAYSPSVSSEYYIPIDEPNDCDIDLHYTMCAYSPEFGDNSGGFLTGNGDSEECVNCFSEGQPINSYWATDVHKSSAYDSDTTSPAMSLTMEPLLGQVTNGSPIRSWESGHYVSYKDRDGGYYYEKSPPMMMNHYMMGDPPEPHQESWGSRSLRQALGELDEPLGISPALSSPPQACSHPYIETNQTSIIGKSVLGGYYDMMGSLRKTMPNSHTVSINKESERALFFRQGGVDSEEEEDLFVERQVHKWSSHSNNKSLRLGSCHQQDYADLNFTMPSRDVSYWADRDNLEYRTSKSVDCLEANASNSGCPAHGAHNPAITSAEYNPYIYLYREALEDKVLTVEYNQSLNNTHFDPLTSTVVKKNVEMPREVSKAKLSLIGCQSSSLEYKSSQIHDPEQHLKQHADIALEDYMANKRDFAHQDDPKPKEETMNYPTEHRLATAVQSELEQSGTVDSGIDKDNCSVSLVETDDCSVDDITDITSRIFADLSTMDYADVNDYTALTFKSLQKQEGTSEPVDSNGLPSSSNDVLSPASFHPSSSPKTVDSGYDTENNESPEFVLREHHDQQEPKTFVQPLGKPAIPPSLDSTEPDLSQNVKNDPIIDLALAASLSNEGHIIGLTENNPYRDSAYLSDYDSENEKYSHLEQKDLGGKELEGECESEQIGKGQVQLKHEKDMEHIAEIQNETTINKCFCPTSLEGEPEKLQYERFDLETEVSSTDMLSEPFFCKVSQYHITHNQDSTDNETTILSSDLNNVHNIVESIAEIVLEEKERNYEAGISTFASLLKNPKENLPKGCEKRTVSNSREHITNRTGIRDKGHGLHYRPSSPPPPLPPKEGRGSPADGEEADEEDGSEDSDESEEELRTCNIQDQSDESEDDHYPVPIIISDFTDAHKLRSLLKMPTGELETKKKLVSFFDDVTVYLFDQESPTQELADHPPGLESNVSDQNLLDKTNTHDDSQGNISDESVAFEWDDDFPLIQIAAYATANKPSVAIEPKPVVQFSRFTVSPVSRFSITHVTDSDVDSAGGSSEE